MLQPDLGAATGWCEPEENANDSLQHGGYVQVYFLKGAIYSMNSDSMK